MKKIHDLLMFLQLTAFILLFNSISLKAQENITFQTPPKEIMELADYKVAPRVIFDSKDEYMIFSYRDTYQTLAEISQEVMKLAGIRINPRNNMASDLKFENNLKVRKVVCDDGLWEPVQVKGLPQNLRISEKTFSPDEKLLAFTNTTDTDVELWVLDIAKAEAKRVATGLNGYLDNAFIWLKDSKSLLIWSLPSKRPSLLDPAKDLPKGPSVLEGKGKESQARTYPDLLKNEIDIANFETLATSELNIVNLEGERKPFLGADIYVNTTLSPDGQYLLVTTIHRPYSFIVPMDMFPTRSSVYDLDGNLIKIIYDKPLFEGRPKGSSSTFPGMRLINWRADKPASLYYAIALDNGNQAVKVDFRDEIFSWDAPFTSEPKSLFKTGQRFSRVVWGDDKYAVFMDFWAETRSTRTFIFNPSDPNSAPIKLFDRNRQDVYSDPGNFQTRKNQYGRYTLAIENDKLFLIGDGFTKDGQFPFVDQFDLKTFKTKRLYQSLYIDKMEQIRSIEDYKKGILLVNIQSKTEHPNFYFREISKKGDKGLKQLTFFKNPFESIAKVHKEVIKYKRDDGVELSGTLYLPANYDTNSGEKLPLLIWAYPEEFKDANSAGQNKLNPNEFTVPYYGSFVYWVTRGYAVLDDASFPIIGEGDREPNDTFLEQLVADAKAAIDAVDGLGYIDRKKVAVGGHSYGAFMTANLLTHSDLFACGIARSGAYNRTLTPFGFQNEQRNYWDAPEVYNKMSPFMYANKMKTPILLVHGDSDNNTGTFTIQSERYYQALAGLGAPVRLVLLPKEAHSYVARENILHLLWEEDVFLEKYCKGRQ